MQKNGEASLYIIMTKFLTGGAWINKLTPKAPKFQITSEVDDKSNG